MAKALNGRTVDLKAEITLEIEKALTTLGGHPEAGRSTGFYEVLRAHGAKSDLLMIVESYRDDTMDDTWVLRNLRRWNATGSEQTPDDDRRVTKSALQIAIAPIRKPPPDRSQTEPAARRSALKANSDETIEVTKDQK